MNLVELLAGSVKKHGDKTSLQYAQDGEYKGISYSQLWDFIQQFASGLSETGVKSDTRVAILAENCPEWTIADFAILSLKAVVVPIYPTLPVNQIDFILHNANVDLIIVQDKVQYEKILATTHPLKHVILMDIFGKKTASAAESLKPHPKANDKAMEHLSWLFSEVLELGKKALSEQERENYTNIHKNTLATIVHTSGTSGKPKGVMLTHENIVSNVSASLQILPVYPTDISLSYLPLSHVFERTVGHFAPLSIGATIAYAEGIEYIQKNLKQVRPTVLVTVPRLLEKVYTGIQEQIRLKPVWIQRILRSPMQKNKRSGLTYRLVDSILFGKIRKGLGGRIRLVVSGGAGLAEELGRFYSFAGIPVYEGYGMTESAPVIAANPYGNARFGTVGLPLPNVEVALAEDGELLVRGPNVMKGYVNAPDETAKVLEPSGWLHTGDIAEFTDRYIRIVDRKKNLLVLATGKNVAPWPIESSLTLAPHIGAALVIGDGRKYVAAILVPDFDAMKPFLLQHQIDDNPTEWVGHPKVVSLIQAEANAAIKELAGFEQPKRALLLPTEWTIDSGELTPTLKVKRKVVLHNYAHRIEAMYAGKDFIALGSELPDTSPPETEPMVSPDDAKSETLLAAESDEAVAKTTAIARRRRVPWILRGLAAVSVLFVIGVASLFLHPPAHFNLNKMIGGINQNNKKINQQNQGIVGTMKNIQQSSSATPVLKKRLKTVNTGIYNNENYLHQLDGLSQQEVSLSRQFKSLADSMKGNLQSISTSSSQQQKGLSNMNRSTQGVASEASQLKAVQQTVQGKLAQAAEKSKKIASEMP
ncbi:long-chain fatty acid--CoA ligase [Alicyclobacillus sp. SO9]|uniref:AMP-dependent synthetase/ligase n=1 Tax=Alicyclobacillus sp. SO9 TaxID=2665646 RepID=UPI0018E74C60|nr:long-chain fatty acid--CoA ligase [Alicyclobacillus sp. SO9]QQE78286.1 long-chain fatty acid--CoA ligase [Alicyclobacillus sp. SO9]